MNGIQTIQQEINPVDKDFTNLISDIYKDQKQAQRGNQAYLGDWVNIPNTVAYVSLSGLQGVVSFSNASIDPRQYFSVGSIVRYKQGGGFKYAYVTAVTATSFTINSGSTYTLLNATITDFGKATNSTPVGFPILLDIPNTSYTTPIGTFTPSAIPSQTLTQFYMNGPIVTVRVITFFATVSNTGIVFLALPIPANVASSPFRPNESDSTGTAQFGVVKISNSTTLEIYPSMFGAAYPGGVAGATNMNFTIDYVIA